MLAAAVATGLQIYDLPGRTSEWWLLLLIIIIMIVVAVVLVVIIVVVIIMLMIGGDTTACTKPCPQALAPSSTCP